MSEHITHVAICQDVHRLCRVLGEEGGVPGVFVETWDARAIESQLGSVTRQADTFSVDILENCRRQWEGGDDPLWRHKLAFVLGALTHRSIDRHMKPVFEYFRNKPDVRVIDGKKLNECTIYCDALIMREVFGGGGADSPFPENLLDPEKTPSTPALEDLARHVLRRELIRMHTFNPDAANIQAWFDAFFPAVQEFNLRLGEYERVFTRPDPAKWREYLGETNFYNKQSPIIEATRRLRSGEAVARGEVSAAVEGTGIPDGRYARAMARAVGYVRAAGRFWRGEATDEQTREALDVGVPERSLTYPDPA